jgi:hypothetical protein
MIRDHIEHGLVRPHLQINGSGSLSRMGQQRSMIAANGRITGTTRATAECRDKQKRRCKVLHGSPNAHHNRRRTRARQRRVRVRRPC